MIMDYFIAVAGFASFIIIIARILEFKQILIFAGLLFFLISVQILLDGSFQYVSSEIQHKAQTDIVAGNTTTISSDISTVKTNSEIEINGASISGLVAFSQFIIGLACILKGIEGFNWATGNLL